MDSDTPFFKQNPAKIADQLSNEDILCYENSKNVFSPGKRPGFNESDHTIYTIDSQTKQLIKK